MEKDFCKKCGNCCQKIPVDFINKIIYRDGVQKLTLEFADLLIPYKKQDNITFCSCKYLKNKLCTNPNKPDLCKSYPSSPFAFLTDDCGYEGYIFLKNEEEKRKIRLLKEEIIDLKSEFVINTDESKKGEILKNIQLKELEINKYKMYGALDW